MTAAMDHVERHVSRLWMCCYTVTANKGLK